jgi:Icc-related predicted phosphoesterase
MKLLCLSDVESLAVYSANIRDRFGTADAVISCGDLPYPYLEYVISMLDIPLYYVHGNHLTIIETHPDELRLHPWGGMDMHRKVFYDKEHDFLVAGIEGSLIYNKGPKQYSQRRMWLMVLEMVPKLLLNKLRYGRYLDCFISHSPPAGIHDQEDYAHRGVHAFRWLLRWFSPKLHLHGHVHLYMPTQKRESIFHKTRVVNAYKYFELDFIPNSNSSN